LNVEQRTFIIRWLVKTKLDYKQLYDVKPGVGESTKGSIFCLPYILIHLT